MCLFGCLARKPTCGPRQARRLSPASSGRGRLHWRQRSAGNLFSREVGRREGCTGISAVSVTRSPAKLVGDSWTGTSARLVLRSRASWAGGGCTGISAALVTCSRAKLGGVKVAPASPPYLRPAVPGARAEKGCTGISAYFRLLRPRTCPRRRLRQSQRSICNSLSREVGGEERRGGISAESGAPSPANLGRGWKNCLRLLRQWR